MSTVSDKRAIEKRRKEERRLAVRPLREMLRGTYFGIRFPWIGTGTVQITLGGGWFRELAWEDCADREYVAQLQRELLNEVAAWLDEAREEVVTP